MNIWQPWAVPDNVLPSALPITKRLLSSLNKICELRDLKIISDSKDYLDIDRFMGALLQLRVCLTGILNQDQRKARIALEQWIAEVPYGTTRTAILLVIFGEEDVAPLSFVEVSKFIL